MKNKNGASLFTLILIIAIIVVIAGVVGYFLLKDDGVVSNALKMDIETTGGEVRDHIQSLINEELRSASSDIKGTTDDISTRFNEAKLINFLSGNKNYNGTDHDEVNVVKCLEDLDGSIDIIPKNGEGTIKDKYRVIVKDLCTENDKYGIGKKIEDGNIFTLEAKTETQTNEDGTEKIVSTGEFELKYYDKNSKAKVLETFQLYRTKES